MNRPLIIIAALFLAASVSSTVRAAPSTTSSAKSHYMTGMKLYNLGKYAEALPEFEAAYMAKADPAFLFNIGQCQRQLAQYEAAEKSYRAFLREGDVTPQQREQVQRIISEMEKAQAEARAKQPPIGTQPPKEDVAPPPVGATEKQAPARRWFATPMGASGLGAIGLGVVLLGAGGGVTGWAFGRRDGAGDAPNLDGWSSAKSDFEIGRTAGLALIGVGAAVTVVGVALVATAATKRENRASRFARVGGAW